MTKLQIISGVEKFIVNKKNAKNKLKFLTERKRSFDDAKFRILLFNGTLFIPPYLFLSKSVPAVIEIFMRFI